MSGRVLDKGAIFAGWVGLGMALVITLAFELIVAVQSLVFLGAPIAGAVIGAYAAVRSERWRPRVRVMVDAGYAGLVTGVGLAVMYLGIRLLFIYADSGYRTPAQGGGLTCETGPACTYARYLDAGRGPELTAAGVTDAATFGAFVLREQLGGAATLVVLTLGGSIVGGALRASRRPPSERTVVAGTEAAAA